MIVHSRATNLKLDLTYNDWELLAACARTMGKGLYHKGLGDQARECERVALNCEDILSALRAEGHV